MSVFLGFFFFFSLFLGDTAQNHTTLCMSYGRVIICRYSEACFSKAPITYHPAVTTVVKSFLTDHDAEFSHKLADVLHEMRRKEKFH